MIQNRSTEIAMQEIGKTFDGNALADSSYELSVRQQPIKLALFSSGLGVINRGFEISTARIFRAIQSSSGLDTRLYSGGDYPDAQKVWCVNRNSWLRFPLNLFPFADREQLWTVAYALEQTSYCFGLIKDSREVWQPEVVWTKEVPLAHVLYEFRRLSGNPYKIVFANGGGFRPRTYQQFDFIQHLSQDAYDEALAYGIPASKMNVLTNIVPYTPPQKTKAELRAEYGYAPDDQVIICVAAWNKHHKRIDYLIDEVAKAKIPNCKLILCGQPEPDAEELKVLAAEKLGDKVRFITVDETKVRELLHLSDLFVLCSLFEGLGTVMIEAAFYGLPVLSHPHGGSKFVLNDDRWYVDMSERGNLARRLRQWQDKPFSAEEILHLKQTTHNRFDQMEIAKQFEDMIKTVHRSAAVVPARS